MRNLFLFLLIFSNAALFAQVNSLYEEVIAITEKVELNQKFPGEYNPDSVMTLPFGLKKTIGGKSFFLAMDSATFTAQEALCNLYMAIVLPGATRKIAFAAKRIPFNPKGFKPLSSGRMVLASAISVKLGPNITLELQEDGTNFVEWDCNGFKGLSLSGKIKFSNAILLPSDQNAIAQDLTATFQVYTSDPDDILASVSIPPFYIRGFEDIKFSVDQAIFDFSTSRNYTGSTSWNLGNGNHSEFLNPVWTGFFLKQFRLQFPKGFTNSNHSDLNLELHNLFIDDRGISGRAEMNWVSGSESAAIEGWKFGIERLSLDFLANNLQSGSMKGNVFLPLDENTGVNYEARISQNSFTNQLDFSFLLQTTTTLRVSAFSLGMELYPSSTLRLERINGYLKPSAKLNGRIKFESESFQSPFLVFQNLLLSTQSPFISGGIFSLVSSQGASLIQTNSVAGFRASLNQITFQAHPQNPYFYISAGITFTNYSDMAFGSELGIKVMAKRVVSQSSNLNESNAQGVNGKLIFEKIQIEDVALDVQTVALKLHGRIQFKNNDPVYGKGFSGSVSAIIPPLTTPISSSVFFGNKNTYTYFYLDVAIPSTVLIFPPTNGIGLASYRLIGGFAYHMRPASVNLSSSLYTSSFNSSRNYIPDSTKQGSFIVGATLGVYPNSRAANGDCTLETIFNNHGGIDLIRAQGQWYFGVDINERVGKPLSSIPIYSTFAFQYDFLSNIADANLNVNMNTAQANGQGQGHLHLSQNDWQMYFGKPTSRANVHLQGIGNFQMYFMSGNQLEPIPQPPPQVIQICQSPGLLTTRNQNELVSGNGFVLGASFQSSFSNSYGFSFFQVYTNASYGAGFDLMTQKIPLGYKCSGTGNYPGWNGLRASGNVYAYLQGSAGIRGNLKWPIGCESGCLINEDFDFAILNLSLACILTAKIPNPNYLAGSVTAHYDILGKIRGNMDIKFEAGNDCQITQ